MYLADPTEIPPANTPKKVGNGAWQIFSGSDGYHAFSDATLFSSSLPVLPHAKCMHGPFVSRLSMVNLVEVLLTVFALPCSELEWYRTKFSIR